MVDSLVLTIILAAIAFGAIRGYFLLVGWLFPEADKLHRRNLDLAIDWLDRKSLFELGQLVLVRVRDLAQACLEKGIWVYILVVIGSLILNAVVFVVSLYISISAHLIDPIDGLKIATDIIVEKHLWTFLESIFVIGMFGTAFDLVSLAVTLALLYRASVADTGRRLLGHLGIDFVVAAVSCMWAYWISYFAFERFYLQVYQYVVYFSDGFQEGNYSYKNSVARPARAIWMATNGLNPWLAMVWR